MNYLLIQVNTYEVLLDSIYWFVIHVSVCSVCRAIIVLFLPWTAFNLGLSNLVMTHSRCYFNVYHTCCHMNCFMTKRKYKPRIKCLLKPLEQQALSNVKCK